MPFQVEGIKFAVARGGKALIGDEMGKLIDFSNSKLALRDHYLFYRPYCLFRYKQAAAKLSKR